MKQLKGIPIIKCKVLRKCHTYNQRKKQCILRLNENHEIACYKGDNLLKKRAEILATCRHLKIVTQKTDVYINLKRH